MADILARLQLRAGTLAAWTSANPILAAGEPGFEIDTSVMRIGDGSTAFLSLERFTTSDGFAAIFQPLAENLTAFAGLTFAANKLPYGTGIGSFALTDLTAEARVFLAAATKAAQRMSLGLTSAAITPINTATNLTIEPTQLPTRGAVAAAILLTGGPAKRVVFTASGIFVKADHGQYPDDHMVLLQAWGGGGGGAASQAAASAGIPGGSGGCYAERLVRYIDIPTTVVVAIGSGGAVGSGGVPSHGGNTTIGTLLTAYGSQGFPATVRENPFWIGGSGGTAGSLADPATPGNPAGMGGGGGGAIKIGVGSSAPGISFGGGSGGAVDAAGVAPAGGGGARAAGARGEVRIWL